MRIPAPTPPPQKAKAQSCVGTGLLSGNLQCEGGVPERQKEEDEHLLCSEMKRKSGAEGTQAAAQPRPGINCVIKPLTGLQRTQDELNTAAGKYHVRCFFISQQSTDSKMQLLFFFLTTQ